MDVSSFLKAFKKKSTPNPAKSKSGSTPLSLLPQGHEDPEEFLHSSDDEGTVESNSNDGGPLEKPVFSIATRQATRYQRQGLKKNRNFELEPLKVIADHEGLSTSQNRIYNRKMFMAKAVDRRPVQPRPRDESSDAFWKDLLQERQKLKRLSGINLSVVVESSIPSENNKTSLEDRLVSVDKLLSSSDANPNETTHSNPITDILSFLTSSKENPTEVAKPPSHSEPVETQQRANAPDGDSANVASDFSPPPPTVPTKKPSMFQRAKALNNKK
ncbi:unnamed protein product [Phytomonas sp. Hart1]|nr:unnamed protein product [Phytomonas sp. Hart1]|eukprot:CCW70235.1 unnamed protein product [Phytomonas sp. isolate Hart1]